MENNQTLKIGKKSFIVTAITLFTMIVAVGVLAQFIPTGEYTREIIDGVEVVDYDSFHYTNEEALPLYNIFLAPFKVLVSDYIITVIGIFIFIVAIGATISVLEKSHIIKYSLLKVINKYKDNKHTLLRIITLFFMAFGSFFGIFEEVIAFVPILIALAFMLKYDTMIGLGITVFATGVGFASATFNPFTLGVAQNLADVPLYSGILFRIATFIIMYFLTSEFIIRYAKKLDKDIKSSLTYEEDLLVRDKYKFEETMEYNQNIERATKVLYIFLALIMLTIVAGFFIPFISSILILLLAIIFVAAGITAGYVSKYSNKVLIDMLKGIPVLLPGVLLMILAVSVSYLLNEAKIMDTVLYNTTEVIKDYPPYLTVIIIFIFVMIVNFFIPAGSSKAILTIPILIPLAEVVGITKQTTIQAFIFGDGFSNVFFITNPILMICLGLTTATYLKWVKWTLKIQAVLFVVSCILLWIAVAINY